MGYHDRLNSINMAMHKQASILARERRWAWEADRWTVWFFDSRTNRLRKTYMKRSISDLLAGTASTSGEPAAHDKYVEEKFPNTHMLLTCTSLGKGKPRTPSTLFIFAAGGAWKICLGDKDGNRCLWAESDTLAGLTAAIELLLEMPVVPWKPKAFTPGKKA